MLKKIAGLAVFILIAFPGYGRLQQPELFSPQNKVYLAALVSAAAYDTSFGSNIAAQLENLGWRQVRGGSSAHHVDMQYVHFMQEHDGVTYHVIAFRGTEGKLKDIKVDLQAKLVPFGGQPAVADKDAEAGTLEPGEVPAKVHKGFLRYAEAAWEQDFSKNLVRELLKHHPSSPETLIITGHSLGGAAAALYGALLLEEGVSPEAFEVISFAAPAFCNASFKEKYRAMQLHRIVYADDPVPKFVQKIARGYCHMGNEEKFSIKLDNACDEHQMSVYLDFAMAEHYRLLQGELNGRALSTESHPAKPVLLVHQVKTVGGQDEALVDLFNIMLKTHYQSLAEYYDIIWADTLLADSSPNCDYELFTYTEAGQPAASEVKRYTTVYQELVSTKDRHVVRAAAFGNYYSTDMSRLQMFFYNLLKAWDARNWLPPKETENS